MLDQEKPLRPAAEAQSEITARIAEFHADADARLLRQPPGPTVSELVADMQAQEEDDLNAREASEPGWYRELGEQLEAAERLTEAERPGLRAREMRRTFGAAVDQAAFE